MADLPRMVQRAIEHHLDEIAEHFERPKVTLLIRFPELEAAGKDADVIVTSDNLADVAAMIERRRAAE